ncbi:hypothetical protein Tco_0583128 [Tanacetum coccineum]
METASGFLVTPSGYASDGVKIFETEGVRDPLVSKHGMGGNQILPKQQVPNSVFHKKMTSIRVSNAFSTLKEDNEEDMGSSHEDGYLVE